MASNFLNAELPSPHTTNFYNARQIPRVVWDAWASRPFASNIMYPHALATLAKECSGAAVVNQMWISCMTGDKLDFVLSCTSNPMGTYPIFIFTTHANPSHIDHSFICARISLLVHALMDAVPHKRVYSVFAPAFVSILFREIWSSSCGIEGKQPAYYSAMLSYCTRESFNFRARKRPESTNTHELRPGNAHDIPEVAILCRDFALKSPPFTLDLKQATKEATILIEANQLWVHRMTPPNGRSEIACIVVAGRSNAELQTSAITKVFTVKKWRSHGCAERLVRRVCQQLLFAHGRQNKSVVLYVAHDNIAAAKAYTRVGFLGIAPGSDEIVSGAEPWLELGFDPAKVEIGHW